MIEIKAFIRYNKVTEIVHQLKEAGFDNITISTAEGTGKLQDEKAFVSTKFAVTDSVIAKIELVTKSANVEMAVNIISKYARTLNPGDGLIYISDIQKVIRVKDGTEIEK